MIFLQMIDSKIHRLNKEWLIDFDLFQILGFIALWNRPIFGIVIPLLISCIDSWLIITKLWFLSITDFICIFNLFCSNIFSALLYIASLINVFLNFLFLDWQLISHFFLTKFNTRFLENLKLWWLQNTILNLYIRQCLTHYKWRFFCCTFQYNLFII